MGSQTLQIARQGVWASLTGGWFYDPHQSLFCNTFHFYLWMFLLSFPFIIYLCFPPSPALYTIYCGVIGALFVILKLLNHYLHRMFDTSECIEESVPEDELPDNLPKTSNANKSIVEEGIEMQILKPEMSTTATLNEPTDDDGSLNSNETVARVTSSTIDFKVDVHRKNSSGSSEEQRDQLKALSMQEIVIQAMPAQSEITATIKENDEQDVEKPLHCGKRNRSGLVRNFSAESQDVSATVDQTDRYNLELTANGSCGVLPQPPLPERELMKITGSLELPIKDENPSEKGLLYWKQQNLEKPQSEKLRKAENIMLLPSTDEFPLRSEVSINSTTSLNDTYSPIESVESDLVGPPEIKMPATRCEEVNPKEEVITVLENFDWQAAGFTIKRRRKSRSRHRENCDSSRGKASRSQGGRNSSKNRLNRPDSEINPKSPEKKIDLDDDSSGDEAGSQSPLLCRHESHEKGSCYYQKAGAVHLARASINSKWNSAMLSECSQQNASKIFMGVNPSQSYVYNDLMGFGDYVRLTGPPSSVELPDTLSERPAKLNFRRESFLHGNKKLSLTSPIDLDAENSSLELKDSMSTATEDGEKENAVKSRKERWRETPPWPSLDWLFENTDSETNSQVNKIVGTKDSTVPPIKITETPLTGRSLGAIPKTIGSRHHHHGHHHHHHHHNHRHRSSRSRRSSDSTETRSRKKKHVCERENGIIDEEDGELLAHNAKPRSDSLPIQHATSPPLTGANAATAASRADQYDSSSGSTTELSSLLPLSSLLSTFNPPASPLLAAFLASRTELPVATRMPGIDGSTLGDEEHGVLEEDQSGRRVHRGKGQRSLRSSCQPISGLPAMMTSNLHIALSFNDTSQGAIHCFEDERGKWWSYAFDTNIRRRKRVPARRRITESWDSNINLCSNSNSENESSLSASPRLPRVVTSVGNSSGNPSVSTNSSSVVLSLGEGNNNIAHSSNVFLEQQRHPGLPDIGSYAVPRGRVPPPGGTRPSPQFNDTLLTQQPLSMDFEPYNIFMRKQQPKRYYKLFYTPWHHIKIRFDRLELIALLDRSLTWIELSMCLLLSTLVSVCAILLLSYNFYRDLQAFFFCLTVAGCHYSLIKSVQPDASSPTHGYNRIVIYSRSVYFCLVSAIILILSSRIQDTNRSEFHFYRLHLASESVLRFIRDGLVTLLLFFPVLFTLGLFPQINTFALHLAEQVDIHVFGGSAIPNLIAAAYCITRSVAVVILVFGFAYGALGEAKQNQHVLFSIFCALVVTLSYHLSRCSSDPSVFWNIIKEEFKEKPTEKAGKDSGTESQPATGESPDSDEFVDPLPVKLMNTVHSRLINDIIVGCFVSILVFAIHCSSVFSTLQPDLNHILWVICGSSGLLVHYIIPQLRKHLPWLCLAQPVLRSHEHEQFEVWKPARVMWFEEVYLILCFLEKNILYPVLVLATVTYDAPQIVSKFGVFAGALITSVCAIKVMRSAFSSTPQQYLIVVFSALLFEIDFGKFSETFLVDYFFIGILFAKMYEFLLKLQFVVTYIAPWQITWGSAFHAFAQPFSVPHSAMLFTQAILSAVLSAPLNPFLGSAIFIVSYVRPIKFWERDYNTKRVDQSNIRLSSHLERNLGSDDNNLNSIFYEHLTRSLQHSLCGDLQLGRWGPVSQGDCFVLASDYLNCLIHIIEIANGLVTFQVRGLEFRGTYCQQREVEAITENEENEGCCCCEPGHLPNVLSVNAAFSQRWLAWEVTATKYILEGYSISDNSAVSMLQVFDFRKVLITYYVKSIIWYCVRSPLLEEWLSSIAIQPTLQMIADRNFVDLDPVFTANIDQDFDFRAEGITRLSFCSVYHDWIQFCASKREKPLDNSRNSPLVSLCLALSLMGRRALGTASVSTVSSAEFFLYGLHALFKGDFRITSIRDEWVFSDMELLKRVVAPAVRMSLKLHQDHFRSPDEYEDNTELYDAMSNHEAHLVISHEGDPAWRNAVLSGTPSLLALRHVFDDAGEDYKVIMLNKRYLSFRVIKLNRECVRGLWAGQQQELVFLRNRNPERGSIQNAKQALRNMINSSCDQPIGYPIYVSPLTTSYADSNSQLSSVLGGPISLGGLKTMAMSLWKRVRTKCRQGCSSGIGSEECMGESSGGVFAVGGGGSLGGAGHATYGHNTSGSQSMDSSQIQLGASNRGGSLGRNSVGGRGSFPSGGKPSSATLVSLAGLLSSAELAKGENFLRERETSFTSVRDRQSREDCCRKYEENRKSHEERDKSKEKKGDAEESKDKEGSLRRVKIVDPKQVFDAINLGRRIDVLWPDETMRARGGRSYWKDWLPDTGMEGVVVHKWVPNHRDPSKRSHVDKTILLLRLDNDRYVPIAESGVADITNRSTSTLSSHNDADAYLFNAA